MGTNWIKVSQDANVPVLIRPGQIHEDMLHDKLGLAVRIGQLVTVPGVLLVQGQVLGSAVNGGTTRENEVLDIIGAHHIQDIDGTCHK